MEVPVEFLFEGEWQLDHITIRVRLMTKEEEESSQADGQWLADTRVVLIRSGRQPWEQVELFFHEMLHAFHDVRHRGRSGKLTSEQACMDTGAFVATLLRQNPRLAKLISKL